MKEKKKSIEHSSPTGPIQIGPTPAKPFFSLQHCAPFFYSIMLLSSFTPATHFYRMASKGTD